MNLTVTYHHTTTDKFDIYQLQDMDKEEFNDGRCIIFSNLEWCEELRDKMIKENNKPKFIQRELDI